MEGRGQRFIFYGIVAGVLAGGLCGWFFGEPMARVKFLGELFLHALFLLIVPLIFFSMIAGIASLGDVRRIGRTGGAALAYYVLTTLAAVFVGLLLVNLIQPGRGFQEHAAALTDPALASRIEASMGKTPVDAFKDILFSILPENILDAAARQQILPVIVFALVFGGVLTTLGKAGKPVLEFCLGANEAMMAMVKLVMYAAPVGIFGLVAGRLGEQGGGEAVGRELAAVGWYAGTVLLGLAVHALVVLPLLLYFLGRRAPHRYAAGAAPALLTAFSTASSSATLPVTIRSVTERNLVRSDVASFVLPLGATVNMDGTGLYEAVAAVFIGQAFAVAAGVHLGLGGMLIIAVTATLAAIGAAGIPEAGLVTMLIVLTSVGYPPEVITAGMASILSIDWFLDRCRTAVNVWGDAVGAAVVERWAPPLSLDPERQEAAGNGP